MDTALLSHLVERCRTGDREAFGNLIRHYQGTVCGIAYGLTGDLQKSEDLAQETFLVAWKNLGKLNDFQKLPNWLCGIARNLSKKHRFQLATKPTTTLPEDAVARTPDPPDAAIRNEENRLIQDAMNRIPEKYRVSLILYYRNDLPTGEIAKTLGLSEKTFLRQLSRARKYLRDELEKKVQNSVISSGPGELFTLGVLAAIPTVAALTTTGKAVAATAVATESTFAASAMIAAPKSSGGTVSLFGASGWWGGFFSPAAMLLSMAAYWCCWIFGIVPGFWLSIRNAPTLRARRYLILMSMRLHLIFGFLCLILAFSFVLQSDLHALLIFYLSEQLGYSNPYNFVDSLFTVMYIAGIGLFSSVACIALIKTPLAYRRIVREDAGLVAAKNPVPLEESFLSWTRLSKTFYRIGLALIAVYVVCVLTFWRDFSRDLYMASMPCTDTVCTTCGFTYWSMVFRYYSQCTFAGLVFLLVFRQMHVGFLAIAKDEAAFAQSPSLFKPETRFGERVFLEWIVSFGFFLAAGLFLAWEIFLTYTWLPRYPVPFCGILLVLWGGSLLLATITVRFPGWRLFVNLGGFCLLFALVVKMGITTLGLGWDHYPMQQYFESTRSWPLVFCFMLLGGILYAALAWTLLYGAFYVREKWTGSPNRFVNRKTYFAGLAAIVLAVGVAAPLKHDYARCLYWERYLLDLDSWRYVEKRSDYDLPKQIEIADEVIRLSQLSKSGRLFVVNAYQIRAKSHLLMGHYGEAIADYDETIQLWSRPRPNDTCVFYTFRGEAKLAEGDYKGAADDLEFALSQLPGSQELWAGLEPAEIYYNYGYACEKLGEKEKAIAAYDKALELLDRKPYSEEYKVVYTEAARPGYDDVDHKITCFKYLGPHGYKITRKELEKIRAEL